MSNQKRMLAIFVGSFLLLSSLADVALGFKTDPYMKSTRTQLMKARAHLFAGNAAKGEHRAKAMAYTTAAIDEITAGMKSSHHHHARPRASEIFAPVASGTPTEVGSHMRKALIHLKQAKENLGAAAPDAGGHRAKAMELIDKAIEEVEKSNALNA